MASVGTGAVKIIDNDGDSVTVTSNKLDVNATIKGHATVVHFAQNVTDSAVALTDVTCRHADIMANLSNTGIVYIGASGVSATTGIALYPGDIYSVSVARTVILYCISTVSGDDINVVTYT